MLKEVKNGFFTYKGENYEYKFCTNLKASERLDFVRSIIDTVIGDYYDSMVLDVLFDFHIIVNFTDIDVAQFTTGKIDEIEDLLDETTIVETVRANAVKGLLADLRKSVNDNIQYRTGIKHNSVEDALVGLLNTLKARFDGIDAKQLMEYAQRINSISGELTAKNVTEEYFKSDVYKQHLAEAEAKADKRTKDMREIARLMQTPSNVKQ